MRFHPLHEYTCDPSATRGEEPGAVVSGVIAVAASFGVAVWISLTAHEGGRLVHVHGLNGTISQAGSLVLSPAQFACERDNDDH